MKYSKAKKELIKKEESKKVNVVIITERYFIIESKMNSL